LIAYIYLPLTPLSFIDDDMPLPMPPADAIELLIFRVDEITFFARYFRRHFRLPCRLFELLSPLR